MKNDHQYACWFFLLLTCCCFPGVSRSADHAWLDLRLSQQAAESWAFVEGPWMEDSAGIISAPGNNGDENLAFFLGRAFGDFEAEFEFRWDVVWTHAGFIFRAPDTRHYYMVHFPVNGQQYRVEGFGPLFRKWMKMVFSKS